MYIDVFNAYHCYTLQPEHVHVCIYMYMYYTYIVSMPVWVITILVRPDKCQTNHKVGRPLAETVQSLISSQRFLGIEKFISTIIGSRGPFRFLPAQCSALPHCVMTYCKNMHYIMACIKHAHIQITAKNSCMLLTRERLWFE